MFLDLGEFLAGSVGGGLGLLVAQPFDTVKARLQSGKHNTLQTMIYLYNKEGILGFYRGFFVPFLTTGIYNSIFFGVYGSTLKWLIKEENKQQIEDNYYVNQTIAASMGAFVMVMSSCPVELVKIRQQTDPNPNLTAFEVLRQIYVKDGPLGIYRGCVPMLYREVPTAFIYILVYELLSDWFAKDNPEHRHILPTLFAGGCAGVAAWMPILPADVATTLIMSDTQGRYKGMVHCLQERIKKKGFTGLWQGGTIVAIRAFPVNAAIFLGYQQTKKYWSLYYDTPSE